jgi:hypothetical protein
MATHFDKKKYGQRWQVETVNSMIKRLLGSALRSRKTRTQNQEIRLRAITHNVMILWRRVFYRAKKHHFWFSRPFRFEDEWEGLFPPSYIRRTRQYADANEIPYVEFDQEFRRRLRRHRYGHFVNCWHLTDHESDAMWKLYALAKTGIAVQSTVGEVNECLRPHNSGRVIYYDPSHDVITPSLFGPHDILFKRKFFSWEREYRFWFDDDELLERIEAGEKFRGEDVSRGKAIPITDMQRLVKKIVVAPGASDEFIADVRSICADHHKRWLGRLIERSYSDRMWDSFTK